MKRIILSIVVLMLLIPIVGKWTIARDRAIINKMLKESPLILTPVLPLMDSPNPDPGWIDRINKIIQDKQKKQVREVREVREDKPVVGVIPIAGGFKGWHIISE